MQAYISVPTQNVLHLLLVGCLRCSGGSLPTKLKSMSASAGGTSTVLAHRSIASVRNLEPELCSAAAAHESKPPCSEASPASSVTLHSKTACRVKSQIIGSFLVLDLPVAMSPRAQGGVRVLSLINAFLTQRVLRAAVTARDHVRGEALGAPLDHLQPEAPRTQSSLYLITCGSFRPLHKSHSAKSRFCHSRTTIWTHNDCSNQHSGANDAAEARYMPQFTSAFSSVTPAFAAAKVGAA